MAYDEDLAHRLRELLANEDGTTEQPMFGGLAFLLHGNMAVSASRTGGLLVRIDPAATMRPWPGRTCHWWRWVAAR